jgi:hypothetical protein
MWLASRQCRVAWHAGRKADPYINFGISEILLDARVEAEIYRFGPAPHEGRFAIVTDVRRDVMDADGAQRRSAPMRTAKSCGPDAPTLVSSWRKTIPLMTVANKPGHRGERDISRKTIARGMPGVPV